MAKKELGRVYEAQEDLVHFDPHPGSDYVTLCGKTDWIGEESNLTKKPVTCRPCLNIVKYVHAHRKPRGIK